MLEDALFSFPPREFRPVPMWFWNGDIDEEEIRRQVRAFAEGGLGGFQIAARTGLSTPYLSQRWFDLVDLAAQEAAPHGLQVWLADEYPYPSGAAGGELTLRHPEYRAWHMRSRSANVRVGARLDLAAPGSVLLHAGAVPMMDGVADWTQARDLSSFVGITQPEMVFAEPAFGLSKKRSFSYGPRPTLDWTAPGEPRVDEWQVWLIAAAEIAPYKFFGHYVDLCNADAVRAFLAMTYQRYADRLTPAVWQQLTGFFLDEAHPPSWSWSLPQAFARRNGYDLVTQLPALWTDVGPRTAAIRHDYWQTVTELFMESFHRPIAEWCRSHGVQLSLEVDSTRNSVQRHAHVAGNDPGHEKVGGTLDELHAETRPRFRAHPRFPASLAAQVGLNRVLVESYHSIGWSLTFQDMKALADRLAAQGANLFVFHAFLYSLGGLRKWDAPPSQFLQNPYWLHFSHFTDYLSRLCYALSRGRRAASVALLDPITSLWTHGSGAGSSIGGGPDAVAKRVAGDWQYLQRELEAAQRPFDSLDPLLMSEGRVAEGMLHLGEAGYRVIILPPMASLETAAWAKLEEFAAAGGTVIACGLLPYEQIETERAVPAKCAARFGQDATAVRRAYESEEAEDTATGAPSPHRQGNFLFIPTRGTVRQAQAADALLTALEEVAPATVTVQSAGGAAAQRALLVAQRQDGDTTLVFIANAGNEE
ncbi:MAG: glycosyl hydrolase, partial [Chloroflexota bacterium]